jgi:hypothetical protein
MILPQIVRKKNQRKGFVIQLCEKAAEEFKIKGLETLIKADSAPIQLYEIKQRKDKIVKEKVVVTKEFALSVNELLPPQPWKQGIHKEVISKLECTTAQYFSAVELLIAEGFRNRQKDGVVYDSDGNVLCFDATRVDPDKLEIIN